MKFIQLIESLSIHKLNDGHLSLELSSKINWEDFPDFVGGFLEVFNGDVFKKTDAVDIRIWEIKIENEMFRIVFEDFPVMTSIESSSHEGDILIGLFKKKLADLIST